MKIDKIRHKICTMSGMS